MASVPAEAKAVAVAPADDIRDILARATKFYQRWEGVGKTVDNFIGELRGLRADVVHLLNAKESIDRLVKEAEIKLASAERDARTRLASVEQGHRSLVDKLSKREIELSNKMAEIEKRDLSVTEARNRYELLKEEYERKMESLTRVGAAVQKR